MVRPFVHIDITCYRLWCKTINYKSEIIDSADMELIERETRANDSVNCSQKRMMSHEKHHTNSSYNGALKESHRAERVLWTVAGLSVIFIASEVIGGYLASSLAIMSDAFHLFSDLLSFLISIMALRLARKRESHRFTFGYGRAEVLGALTSIFILWVLTVFLVAMATHRIITGEYEVEANTMVITSAAGVFFNVLMGLVLHFGSVEHSHSHGSGPGCKEHQNVNVRAAAVHVIGDLIQSVGVLLAALIIKYTGWGLADPICTFVFSLIVLVTTVTVLKDILLVLMEAVPHDVDAATIENSLEALDGVFSVSRLHIWSISPSNVACAVDIMLDPSENVHEVTEAVRTTLSKKFEIKDAIIGVKPKTKFAFLRRLFCIEMMTSFYSTIELGNALG
ncbi:unnamed protein product [Caenorhabditis auriculariae]|uniref:Uncharacterized protein n=1 Tax=Caenorhabditis auriculariae TaxID=2777116 RepID=A0A8S1HD43_9PELO|nr:unnamed protein product [Caenorhabditis auriculariae]